MSDETKKMPANLRPATRDWVKKVLADYEIEEHHFKILILAAQAYDRVLQAREILHKKGLTFNDRFGQPHVRPEVAVERDSTIVFARLIRELKLDIEPPDNARPPRL